MHSPRGSCEIHALRRVLFPIPWVVIASLMIGIEQFPDVSRTGVQLDTSLMYAEIPAGTRGQRNPAVFGSRNSKKQNKRVCIPSLHGSGALVRSNPKRS